MRSPGENVGSAARPRARTGSASACGPQREPLRRLRQLNKSSAHSSGGAVAQSLGVTVSIVVIALAALAFGMIIRASAGALITLAILLYLLPSFVTLIPGEWGMWSASVMLLNLGSQLTGQSGGPLSPVGAGAVMPLHNPCLRWSYLTLRREIMDLPVGFAPRAAQPRADSGPSGHASPSARC
jgi:hypothetical protein